MSESPPPEEDFPASLSIEGKEFARVIVQRDGVSAIYRGNDEYLRIGEPERIRRDLALHKRMEADGFPVARFISQGKWHDREYFIESSLGEVRLGDQFARDMKESGAIAASHFDSFLRVAERFARAQAKTTAPPDWNAMEQGIHLDLLLAELPEYRDRISARFEEVKRALTPFPFVLTHGDFNPQNMYPDGIIDLEDSFSAPFGYDLMTALHTIDYVPDGSDYEFTAKYRFTSEQQEQYRAHIDGLAQDLGLPALTPHESDFEFCRGAWMVVRMHKWPKIQKFRYNLFIKRFLS